MLVGLVTPPGVLHHFVADALDPAGHALCVAPELDALLDVAEKTPDVIAVALPLAQACELLACADEQQLGPDRFLYLGVDGKVCERARSAGFARALQVPFSARDFLAAVERSTGAAPRVLLADDSELIHKHTVPILREAGYEVGEAWDGAEALHKLRTEGFHLLITDVEMPHKDGIELCRDVKSDPNLIELPVVICSSLGEARDLERGFDAGADDYLIKPVVAEELTTRIQTLLAKRALSERERVLVVDDSAAVRHMIAECLRRQGFRVDTAIDGVDGLDKAAANPPDLVLTDYDMPRATGFELVLGLRRSPRTRDLPIVMLTARDSGRDQAQMRAAGVSSYLVKPFSTDKCIAIVERVLAENRLARYKKASRLYVSDATVRAAEQLSQSTDLGDIRANEVDATILFSDLSGFTSMSATMSPSQVVEILNQAFDELCIAIRDAGGDIDKFIGDAIMAVFEDRPDHDAPHALRACRAAWNMQRALDRFNSGRPTPIVMRIGLNCGTLVRGDIGSRYVRRDYTCIGDVVNRAQRHEAKCPLGGVLLSAEVHARVAPWVQVEEISGITLKGIDHPVQAYSLLGWNEPAVV